MEWMGQYQNISELVIRVMNKYTYLHNKQLTFKEEHSISFSEAQVIEEIARNKDSNMTALSKELGVTKAAVTKTMKKLEKKGYITRYKMANNNKDIFMSITSLGKEIYKEYQSYIYEVLFKDLYELLDINGEKVYETLSTFFKLTENSLQKITEQKL